MWWIDVVFLWMNVVENPSCGGKRYHNDLRSVQITPSLPVVEKNDVVDNTLGCGGQNSIKIQGTNTSGSNMNHLVGDSEWSKIIIISNFRSLGVCKLKSIHTLSNRPL